MEVGLGQGKVTGCEPGAHFPDPGEGRRRKDFPVESISVGPSKHLNSPSLRIRDGGTV